MATIKTVFQFRRATTEEWLANGSVIPAAGEPCFDLTAHTLKIGDGTTAYENLPSIGGVELKVEADGKSIVLQDNLFQLMGFKSAEVGAQPRKNADGELEWVVPSTETVEGLQTTVAGLQKDVTNLHTSVTEIEQIITPAEGETLLGRVESLETKMDGTGEGTVDAKIDAKIKAFAELMTPESGKVDTLMEVINFVESHGEEAIEMSNDIDALKVLVGEKSVQEQIEAASRTIEDEAKAVFKRIKYEIPNKPVGTLVDYREKEIRVMCPADTKWALQSVGAGGDGYSYYIGMKAYAPDNAVSFKEDLAEIISDNTMYYFDGNDFAGVDQYGRKYSIVWLPVAKYDTESGTWTYNGAASNDSKYLGWFYSVEWYDADGVKIESDCIRINLSNEACHNSVKPYYMGTVVSGAKVGDTLLDVVNGIVNVPVGAGLKGSEEIVINKDGSLGIGVITWDKIAEGSNELILDGGGASAAV